MKKIIKSLFSISMLVLTIGMDMCIDACACGINNEKDVFEDYISNKRNVFKEKGYKNIDKKVEKEMKKHSTKADKEVEKLLNEQGIFDEDIKGLFTDEELKELDNNDIENMEVYITYYAAYDG